MPTTSRVGVVTFPGSLDDRDAMRAVKAAGAEPVSLWHGDATLQGVDAVVSMLPNGAIVKSVYEADVLGQAPAGALFLDCSTIDLATAREVGQAAKAAGYEMVDPPVSGGIAAANGGTLTFMVGGSEEAFARAQAEGAFNDNWTADSALDALYWLLKGMCSDWLLFGKRFDLAKEGAEAVHRLMKGFQRSSAS